jgi:tetratricopeptide (TPR) repeat protein
MKYLIFIILIFFNINSLAVENPNLIKGKKLYLEKKYNDAKIEFEKSIVFNPKNTESYLYLSKIFNQLKNLNEEEKNLKTTLLLEPQNEEALYLIINLYIQEGDFKAALTKYELLKKTCINCENFKKAESLIEKSKINDK